MRHDFELVTCDTYANYLEAVIDEAVLSVCPVVTVFDDMSNDEADRIVVRCESGETKTSGPANAVCVVDVVVKTLLRQPSMQDDVTKHFERVNAVRDALTVADTDDAVNAYSEDGIAVDRIEPVRRFETRIVNGDGGFIESKLELQTHVHTTEEE